MYEKVVEYFEKNLCLENLYFRRKWKLWFGWQMDNIQVFEEPIEAKGHLSLWEYNIEKEFHQNEKSFQNQEVSSNF